MKDTAEDTPLLTHLKAQRRELAVAIDRAQDLCALVRARQSESCDRRLARAATSRVAPLQRFATGLRAAYEAVQAGRTLPWSNGPVEGQMNRLKRLKRQMVARANIDPWRQQFLRAA